MVIIRHYHNFTRSEGTLRKPDFEFNALVTSDVFNDGWVARLSVGFPRNFKSTSCCVMQWWIQWKNHVVEMGYLLILFYYQYYY